MTADLIVQKRREELVTEAQVTLDAIHDLGKSKTGDPFNDPATLARAVTLGIMDAPHLRNNPFAQGRIMTCIRNGACVTVDPKARPVSESERLSGIL
jgi:hypothetical protein